MKLSRVLISIILCALLIIGCFGMILNTAKTSGDYSKTLENARKYSGKKLYQKSVSEYENALKNKDTKSIRNEMLDTIKLGIEDGVFSNSKYSEACEEACEEYPDDASFWESLINFYYNSGDYKSAYRAYNSAVKNGVKSNAINDLGIKVSYTFTVKTTSYNTILYSPNGLHTVEKNDEWNILNGEGKAVYSTNYKYITPIASDYICAYTTEEKGTRVIDSSGVVQNILGIDIINAKAYSDGIIPYSEETDVWKFYDCANDKPLDSSYQDASAFGEKYAAVKDKDKWYLADKSLKKVSGVTFDDVKLYQNGEYEYYDVMIASTGGKYQMFNASGKAMNSFTASDMDNYYGGYVAFKNESGLWGFIDSDGKVVIKAQFKDAKSFSNGLAAVSNGENWGFIRSDGTVVIDYKFFAGGYFNKKGICSVSDHKDTSYFIKLTFFE